MRAGNLSLGFFITSELEVQLIGAVSLPGRGSTKDTHRDPLCDTVGPGGFDLLKWCTNNKTLWHGIPQNARSSQPVEFRDTSDIHALSKVLGLKWNHICDTFSFSINIPVQTGTKRKILSTIARIWDPLGFLAAVTLYAKNILKDLWLSKIDWDESLPPQIDKRWSEFHNEFHLIEQLQIPRYVGLQGNSGVSLIGFSDASSKRLDDPSDLTVITPVMFLREQHAMGTLDCDDIDRFSISKRIRNTQTLRDNLRQRFRIECLGQLVSARGKNSSEIKINELVLIGNDFNKLIDWPLGRVVEFIPGRDGELQLVRVKTAKGVLLGPVQRLFPLECKGPDEEVNGMEQLQKKSPTKEEEECAGVSKSREIVKLFCPGPYKISSTIGIYNTTRTASS
ncbi:hypothetical protein NQ315_008911 [Exocentrus adspersus]|uniref:DUF5641 domain-containing protein n=1 Tax=Exocentrus adspersus TaxID=1586481 RepID=A0AAV8V6W1_9CUCU|nr:hypothetical protein NQ315_008911 [Exocentrus adspersus]